jgi:hypothetical protein
VTPQLQSMRIYCPWTERPTNPQVQYELHMNSHFASLRCLDVWKGLVSLGMTDLSHLPASLTELRCELEGIYDETVPTVTGSLAHLVNLRTLHLRQPSEILHDAIDSLVATFPPSLRDLDLTECHLICEELSFAHLPALQSVVLAGTGATHEVIVTLPLTVQCLDVTRCSFLSPCSEFARFPRLRSLGANFSALIQPSRTGGATRGGSQPLPPSLRDLFIHSDVRPPWSIPAPTHTLRHLTTLRIRYSAVEAWDLSQLTQLHTLEILHWESQRRPEVIAPMLWPPHVTTLSIHSPTKSMVAYPPASVRTVQLHMTFHEWSEPVACDWSSTQLRELHIRSSFNVLDALPSMFATLPATVERLRYICSLYRVPEIDPPTATLDLTHLPALQWCQVASSHPVMVHAFGRRWKASRFYTMAGWMGQDGPGHEDVD